MNYILVLISNVFLAFDFALAKKYQSCEGTSIVPSLKYNTFNGLMTAVLFLLLTLLQPGFSLFSMLMAVAMSACVIGYSILGFRLLRAGNIASYTLFLMTGGMVLPYIFGLLFLDEPLTAWRVTGLVVIIAAVILSGRPKDKMGRTQFLLCVAVFFLNGCVSTISKCHQVSTAFPTVSTTAFVMYTGLGKFLCSGIALVCLRPKKEQLSFNAKISFPIIACSALMGGISYLLQLIGAKDIPATVLYPLITGGSIVFSALSGKIFFREKITLIQWISIGLCFIGTVMFI